MSREDLHFRLRIPETLKFRISETAQENRRSMTAEIIARLEETFVQDDWLPSGLDHDSMIVQIEEEMSQHADLRDQYDRDFGFDRFDTMKDEILAEIRTLGKK